jgi:hypothetical protein
MLENINILGLLDTYFKPIITVIASGFAVYFAIQKLGTKVVARYVVSSDSYLEPYISKLVLSNKKDKTICIWSVHAVFEKDLQLKLDEFDPPCILKPYETISLSLPKYTKLYVDSDEISLDYISGKFSLYLDIGNKLIKCDGEKKRNCLEAFTKVIKSTWMIGKHVYSEQVNFILEYKLQGKEYIAFIDKNGFIGNEWSFSPNYFGKSDVSVSDIKNMLEDNGFNNLFTNYLCYKNNNSKLEIVFSKDS